MKKLGLIVAALALVLGFSQCKKENTPANNDEGVRITLSASYGNGGEKSGFVPGVGSGDGSFVWADGATEYIYVGGSEHTDCLGVLSGTGNGTGNMTFSGDLDVTPTDGETLHFFYLGKGRAGTSVTTLDFSTQDGTLANVTDYHIAMGNGSYSSSTVNYATTLDMLMSIAYFDVSGFVSSSNVAETVYLHGADVYTTATIDYQNGAITGGTKGLMRIGTAAAGAYVALLPSGNTDETWLYFDSNSKEGKMKFLSGIQPAKYYANNGAALNVNSNVVLEGSLSGLFSVSATQRVRFSKGNLKYHCSLANPEWRFADNQYEHVAYNASDYGENTGRWIYNFGWGTSGYGHRTLYFQPWSNEGSHNDYIAYNDGSKNLYDGDGKADWGYNKISNGGNTENIGWRTMTADEMNYLLFSRPASAVAGTNNARFARAYLFGTYYGVIVFPDNYTHPEGVASPNYINVTGNNGLNDNQYSEADWLKMEAAGCVFLTKTSGTYDGQYWSSKIFHSATARCLWFSNSNITVTNDNSNCLKNSRLAVRLVRNR